MKNIRLNKEEAVILKNFETGKLKSVKSVGQKKGEYQKQAKYTLSKPRNINIRLSQVDLQRIKALAADKGLPYQTFIGSVLHQYSRGKIKDSSR